MSLRSLTDKLLAIVRRDLLVASRYPGAAWLIAVGLLLEIAGSYYLAKAIGPGFRPGGMEYFPFLLIGAGFYAFLLDSVYVFVRNVHDAQMAGTLEVLATSSTPMVVTVCLGSLSAVCTRLTRVFLYLIVGLTLFGARLSHPNLGAFALVFFVSLIVCVAMGIAAAAVQIATQKAAVVMWAFGIAASLLSGMTFPTTVLPAPLQKLSALVPFTHSLAGFRGALLQSATTASLLPHVVVLALEALLLVPLSLWLMSWVLNDARRHGTLSFY